MEARVRRRLSLLASHINPSQEALLPTCLSAPPCSSWDANGENEVKEQEGCAFCKIIRGEAPALKVYEDDACLCILDTYPLCHGAYFVGIFKPVNPNTMLTLEKIEASVLLAEKLSLSYVHADSFNLLVNNGAAAGQVIYHTHIHIIPRKAHDCLWDSESIQRRPLKLDQEGSQLANRIRENLSFVIGYEDGSEGQASTLVGN
ncbi:UNVERIFIED_CONTAM: Adenylylsulfatase HINT3 [Sesamum angustifolium]|uniref:Adenylylsulfatase HINT3 n=1 Tax=Sesamum angustifolium TaxID=2727405 RepID=A0AAW2QNC3_9LAMI